MSEYILRYFIVIVCSFYTYAKMLNIKITVKYIVFIFVIATILSGTAYYVRLFFAPLSLPIVIVLSVISLTLITGIKLELSITSTILSLGISFIYFNILSILFAIVFRLAKVTYTAGNISCFTICISAAQLLLICLLFRFRRLKNGMPFLRSIGSRNIGVFISVAILCSVMILSNQNTENLYFTIFVAMLLLGGVFILFWWRSRLTKMYIERLRADEVRSLHEIIQKKDEQIEDLRQQNDVLAGIIHKDNKLIPAMALAVREYLKSDECSENTREKGSALAAQLETMFDERSGVIRRYQSEHIKLPQTNVLSIDSLMVYMFSRAREGGVELKFTVCGNIKYMTENVIPDTDLRTMLADLIENAVISTKNADNKRILVSIGISRGCYLIDILDSGIPFEIDTIVNLGTKKATTHADEGGSGIGLVTIFRILKNYRASLIIEEFFNNRVFTKRLSVIFDGLNQYILKTMRSGEIIARSQRDDLVVLSVARQMFHYKTAPAFRTEKQGLSY